MSFLTNVLTIIGLVDPAPELAPKHDPATGGKSLELLRQAGIIKPPRQRYRPERQRSRAERRPRERTEKSRYRPDHTDAGQHSPPSSPRRLRQRSNQPHEPDEPFVQFDGNLLLQVGPISDDCRSVQLEFPETYTRKVAPPAASFETVTMNQLLKDCPPLENGEDHEVHSASLLVAHKRFELVEKKTMNRDREIVFHQLYHEKLERERISQTQRYKQEVLGAPKVLPKLPVSIESLESGTRIKAKFVETVAPLPVADSSNSLFAPSAADKNMIRSTVANPTIDTQAVEISGQSIDSVKEDNNAGTVKISGVDKGLITPRNIIKIRLLKPPTNQMVEKKTVDRRKSAGSARPVGRPRKQPILQNPVVIVPKLLQTPEIKRVAARQKLAYIPESIPIVAGQRRKSDRVSFAFGHPIAPIDRFDMDYNNAIYDIFQLIKKRE